MPHATPRSIARKVVVLALAAGMVLATASPSAATYCIKRNDEYIICVS